MHQPGSRVPAFAVLAVVTLSLACSGSEQTIIGQFFSASRLRDNTSLDNIATVIFDPRTQGTVITFAVQNIAAEQRKPLQLKSLAQAQDDPGALSERQFVDRSLNGGRSAIDVAKYDGEVISKDVTVSAPVRLPSGEMINRTIVVTLQRAVLRGGKEAKDITGRWIVTKYRDDAPATANK